MSSINRIDAKQLKYNKTQLTELNAHILELLLDIDNEISDSHESGKFFINHKLLSVFNVKTHVFPLLDPPQETVGSQNSDSSQQGCWEPNGNHLGIKWELLSRFPAPQKRPPNTPT